MPIVNITLYGVDFELEYLIIEKNSKPDEIHYTFWIHEKDEKKFLQTDEERKKIIKQMINDKRSKKRILNYTFFHDSKLLGKLQEERNKKFPRIKDKNTGCSLLL